MLKEMNVNDLNAQHYSYQMSVHYMDLINDCEKLGDYVVNVVEAHVNHMADFVKQKKSIIFFIFCLYVNINLQCKQVRVLF